MSTKMREILWILGDSFFVSVHNSCSSVTWTSVVLGERGQPVTQKPNFQTNWSFISIIRVVIQLKERSQLRIELISDIPCNFMNSDTKIVRENAK